MMDGRSANRSLTFLVWEKPQEIKFSLLSIFSISQDPSRLCETLNIASKRPELGLKALKWKTNRTRREYFE